MYNISNTTIKTAVEAALTAQTRVFKQRISLCSVCRRRIYDAKSNNGRYHKPACFATGKRQRRFYNGLLLCRLCE